MNTGPTIDGTRNTGLATDETRGTGLAIGGTRDTGLKIDGTTNSGPTIGGARDTQPTGASANGPTTNENIGTDSANERIRNIEEEGTEIKAPSPSIPGITFLNSLLESSDIDPENPGERRIATVDDAGSLVFRARTNDQNRPSNDDLSDHEHQPPTNPLSTIDETSTLPRNEEDQTSNDKELNSISNDNGNGNNDNDDNDENDDNDAKDNAILLDERLKEKANGANSDAGCNNIRTRRDFLRCKLINCFMRNKDCFS